MRKKITLLSKAVFLITALIILIGSTSRGCDIPTGLHTSNLTSTSVTLGWTAVSGASSYNIRYRKVGVTSWTLVTSTTNSKSLTGLTASTQYQFKVKSFCGSGHSVYSVIVNFTTPASASCGTPSGLSASSITTSSATLNWSAVSGAVSYNVHYRVSGTSSWTNTTSSSNSKAISSLAASTTYEFQVQTVCSGTSGSYSSSATFTTPGATCGTPSGLSASAVTTTSATLGWTAVSGAMSYNIHYRISGASSWISTTSTSTSKSLSSLTPGTTYEFQVQTVCSGSSGAYSSSATFTTASSSAIPRPDHIVICIMENHGYSQIIGSSSAPRINALATDAMSALFTQSYGIGHPSQPNYLELFSGSNQGITDDNVPSSHFTTANLAKELQNGGRTFITYSEDLPSVGYDGASSGSYQRKHNPVANWMGSGTNQVSSLLNQPFTSFPSDFTALPVVSYVVPNQANDMHDGTVSAGDTWFYNHMNAYVQWAKAHNSLFILTFDEDDGAHNNQIATIFTGAMVKQGQYSTHITHYTILRTIEDMYALTHAGNSVSETPIHGCWTNGYRTSELADNTMDWVISPNPFNSELKVTYSLERDAAASVYFFNSIGEVVYKYDNGIQPEGLHQLTIDFSDGRIKSGVYFMRLIVDGAAYSKKVVKVDGR